MWAIRSFSSCLSKQGTWDYEPNPSSRTKTWLKNHRFDLDTALALAKKHAATRSINGRFAHEFLKPEHHLTADTL